MITILSPAKTLDFETTVSHTLATQPRFSKEPQQLVNILKKLSRKDISDLMKLSEKLADLNYQRFQMWMQPPKEDMVRQALMLFKGEVYVGLDAHSLNDTDIAYSQYTLRIISGLYGYLRPMDLIQAHRLEMGTKLRVGNFKNLYQFWGEKIAMAINEELGMHTSKNLVNLSSNEYFKAVNPKKINHHIVTPVFKDHKNGEYKVISFFAKKARGLMARWIIKNQIDNPKHLLYFSENGYSYNDLLTTNENEIVFTRESYKTP